jgi:hypothetical protein
LTLLCITENCPYMASGSRLDRNVIHPLVKFFPPPPHQNFGPELHNISSLERGPCTVVDAVYDTHTMYVNLHEPSVLLTLYRKVVPSGKETRLPSLPKTFGSTPTRPNNCTLFTPVYMKGEVLLKIVNCSMAVDQ